MRASTIVLLSLFVPAIAGAQGAAPADAPAAPSDGAAPATPAGAEPASPAAAAVPPPYALPPSTPKVRRGLFGGGGLFGGNISCDGTDCGGFREAGGIAGQLGYLFTPKLGVLVDVWAMTSSKNNTSVTFVTSTVNLRYYVLPLLWVQAGVGNGHAIVRASIFSSRSDDVPVGQFAVGYELVRAKRWAIDASFRVAQGTATAAGSMSDDDARTGRSVGLGAHFTYFTMR